MPFTLPSLPWKWIGVVVGALALIAAIYFSIHAYGNSRYDAGVSETDAKWKAASEKLAKQSMEAAGVASKDADKRAEAHAERLEAEKEKLDEAIAAGTDSFDVLFGVRPDARTGEHAP